MSWHAGDGSVFDGGNMTSISIEIIMNDTAAHDKKAYDNGARIAAWLLWKHGLTVKQLVTHTYWVNRRQAIILPVLINNVLTRSEIKNGARRIFLSRQTD